MRLIMNEASGLLKARYGEIQAPLASYITKRAEQLEANESLAFKVFDKRKSTHRIEAYTYDTEMEDMQAVGENGAYPETGFVQGYEKHIMNTTYKNSCAISRELVDDNAIGSLKKKPDKLLRSYYRGRARELAAAIGQASQGVASYTINGWEHSTVCMDGQCVFSTAHAPKVKGANQCNKFSDAFSEGALFAALTKMQNLKDDDGNTLNIIPDTIIIPNIPALKLAVIKAIGSLQEYGSGNNAINPVYGNLEILVWPYLNDYIGSTNTAPWFIMSQAYNRENDGNVYQDRIELEVRSELGNNDENLWKAYARYGYGFVDFRQIIGCGLSGGSSL